jgi:hypothetical protein
MIATLRTSTAASHTTRYHGYEMTKLDSGEKNLASEVFVRCMGCPKGVSRELEKDTKINKGSKLTKCPFRMKWHAVGSDNPAGEWYLTYAGVASIPKDHNHRGVHASGISSRHRASCKRTGFSDLVAVQRAASVAPKLIRVAAKQQFNNVSVPSTLQDIHNEVQRQRRKKLAGDTPVDKILSILDEQEFFVRHEVENGRLKSMFFAHPELVSIYREDCDIIMLDCTYRTNKYKLPLLCTYLSHELV